MKLEQFNLKWETHSDHLKNIMQSLMDKKESADVTLVCDDKVKFRAHKFVLSASSPFFRSIVEELPNIVAICRLV